MIPDEDEKVVAQVLAGNKAAFGDLVDRYWVSAVDFSRRLLGLNEAKDAAQEAFLSAFLGLESLREHARFRAWLFGILANVCHSRIRRRKEGYYYDESGGRVVTDFRLDDPVASAETEFETRELDLMVLRAIEDLPEELGRAVKLHYLQGLRLSEIATLTNSPVGTLKARLHHARARLRDSLISIISEGPKHSHERGFAMIEVVVHDVVARAAKDGKWSPGETQTNIGPLRVILLKEKSGLRILPIWVGPIEGDAIALRLEHIETQRPMTFDLTTKLLSLSNTKIEKIAVTELRNNTYFATMWLTVNGKQCEVDARPSDAIALALHADAPIFIAPETLEGNQSTITAEDEISQLNEQWATWAREGKQEPEPVPMEYKSMRDYMREYRAKQNAAAKPDDQPRTRRLTADGINHESLFSRSLAMTREGCSASGSLPNAVQIRRPSPGGAMRRRPLPGQGEAYKGSARDRWLCFFTKSQRHRHLTAPTAKGGAEAACTASAWRTRGDPV